MPTWFLLLALLLLPPIFLLVGEYIRADQYSSTAFAVFVSLGPVTVLMYRVLAEWTALPAAHLDTRTEWGIIAGPPAVVVTMVVWALYRSTREDHADWTPDSWCARCDTALYADHAGRYYSTQDGYLCPPELRQTGGRRHQPADATAGDRRGP
jgi:hypothetical protein